MRPQPQAPRDLGRAPIPTPGERSPQKARTEVPDEKPPDDLELLRGISGGDPESLRVFFLRWNPRFCSVAQRILRDMDAADDAASETLLRIQHLAAHDCYPTQPEQVACWILRQAKGCAFRRRGSRSIVHTEWIDRLPASSGADEEGKVNPQDEVRYAALQKALARLPKRTRDAVLMRYLDGLSYVKIAALQGGTPTGARSRVARGVLRAVAIIHSRRRSRSPVEGALDLSPEERVHVKNIAAIARAHEPDIGMLALAAEVCRRTGILIHPESHSAILLGTRKHGRA